MRLNCHSLMKRNPTAVEAVLPEDIPGEMALGMHCVSGNQCAGQVERIEQRIYRGHFVGFLVDCQLGGDLRDAMDGGRHQVAPGILCSAIHSSKTDG